MDPPEPLTLRIFITEKEQSVSLYVLYNIVRAIIGTLFLQIKGIQKI